MRHFQKWAAIFFAATKRTQSFQFCLNFEPNLPPENGQNRKKYFLEKFIH